jgi:hypothetical protein
MTAGCDGITPVERDRLDQAEKTSTEPSSEMTMAIVPLRPAT